MRACACLFCALLTFQIALNDSRRHESPIKAVGLQDQPLNQQSRHGDNCYKYLTGDNNHSLRFKLSRMQRWTPLNPARWQAAAGPRRWTGEKHSTNVNTNIKQPFSAVQRQQLVTVHSGLRVPRITHTHSRAHTHTAGKWRICPPRKHFLSARTRRITNHSLISRGSYADCHVTRRPNLPRRLRCVAGWCLTSNNIARPKDRHISRGCCRWPDALTHLTYSIHLFFFILFSFSCII